MISVLWGLASAVVGLLWFMVESMSGRLQDGTSAETQVLWLILTPIAVVGAMVHAKRQKQEYPFKRALRDGVLTSVWSAVFLLVVWIALVTVLVPEYQSYKESGTTLNVLRSKENINQLAQRIKFARMVYAPPTLYVVSVLLPLLTGIVTSCVVGIGLRSKPARTVQRS